MAEPHPRSSEPAEGGLFSDDGRLSSAWPDEDRAWSADGAARADDDSNGSPDGFTDGPGSGGPSSGGLGSGPGDGLFAGGLTGEAGDPDRDRRRSRRALWLSAGAVVVLGAVAVPVALHFAQNDAPALRTPSKVAGLTLDTSGNAKTTADYMRSAVSAGMDLDATVAAVYTDGSANADAHSVIFVGGTGKGSDSSLVTKIMGLMDDSTDGITGVTTEDAGTLGGVMKCGQTTDTSTADAGTDTAMSVCAFADSGTVGIALFPNRTVPASATLMRQMRTGLE
jgi:hypothetical protein